MFCLPKENVRKLLKAIGDGKFSPDEYANLPDTAARRAYVERFVGEDAKEVNALMESKLLLKDWKRGMVSAVKKITGLSESAKRDLVSKIGSMEKLLSPEDEKSFYADITAQKLGAEVTMEEAKRVLETSKAVETLKAKIPTDSPIRSTERLQYGLALDEYHQYLNHLIGKDKGVTFREFITHPSTWFSTVAGTTKGILASLDNSFFGRQGVKMLYTNPDIWARSFVKSWLDIGKELVKIDAMKAIRADILSRPNAINGKYRAGKFDVGVDFEEAFPSTLPEKIPLLGRLYKASESAFNGAALRMRSDYADRMIQKAEENGLNMSDPKQAVGIGHLVNSMTGRGNIGRLSSIGGEINTAVFSIRFLKSNLDILTAHRAGYAIENLEARSFVRKQAALNLVRIIGTIAVIEGISGVLAPGSIEVDPRSSRFMKLKYGNTTIDPTGGMASLVTLASRIVPTMHDGKFSFWTKSAATGKYTDLLAGKYGQQTALDVIDNFWQGKLSPIAGVFRDAWSGQTFQGTKATPTTLIANLVTPLPVQTFEGLMNEPNGAVKIAAMIADELGFSVNPPNPPKKK